MTTEELIERLQCYPRHTLVTMRPVINLESVPCLDLEDDMIIPELFVSSLDHEDDMIVVISETDPVERIGPTTDNLTQEGNMVFTVQQLIEKLQSLPLGAVVVIKDINDLGFPIVDIKVEGKVGNIGIILIGDGESEEEV